MSRSARSRGIGDAVWLLLAYYDMAQRDSTCSDEKIAEMLDASVEDVCFWRDLLQEEEIIQPTMVLPSKVVVMIIDQGKIFNWSRKKTNEPQTDDEFLRQCGIRFKPPEEETP